MSEEEEAIGPDTGEQHQSRHGIKELSATRRGKLGHCTRKMNEINNEKRFGRGDSVAVKAQLEEFHKILKTFKTSHESVQMLLSDDVKENENVDWYEPKIAKFNDFICQTEIWLRRQQDPQSGAPKRGGKGDGF